MPPAASDGVRVGLGRLPTASTSTPRLGELDGRAQAGSAGADHEDGRGELVFARWHRDLLW